MKTIDNDIKTGQFKQIYLLYGEEQYLIRQYRDKLKHALAADDDTMNFSAFSGSDINQKEIIDLPVHALICPGTGGSDTVLLRITDKSV